MRHETPSDIFGGDAPRVECVHDGARFGAACVVCWCEELAGLRKSHRKALRALEETELRALRAEHALEAELRR